jgi:hypothetical protein
MIKVKNFVIAMIVIGSQFQNIKQQLKANQPHEALHQSFLQALSLPDEKMTIQVIPACRWA